jgi:hypothetical protein
VILLEKSKEQLLPLIFLFIVFAWHIGRYVNDFYVPESDFFDFRDKAMTLRAGEWPQDFKRPPLYSALVALGSAAIQGRDRELYASEALGIIAAALSFFLVYAIARRFFKRAALLVVWLWAFHPSSVRMAVKPKSEMLVTALILLSFYLFLRQKKAAYIAGFLASLVRYEGALIIAAIAAADFFTLPKKLKIVAYALLAGGFIVLWTLLQSGGGDGTSYFAYFNGYKPNFAFIKAFWNGLIGFLPPTLFKSGVLCGAMLYAAGLVELFRRNRRDALAMFFFFIGFMAMHIIWPMPNFDYQVIIAWNALLMMSMGMAVLWRAISVSKPAQRIHLLSETSWAVIFALIVLFGMTIFLMLQPVTFPQYQVRWSTLLLLFAPAAAALWMLHKRAGRPLAVVLLIAAFFMAADYWISSTTAAQQYDIRYSKAEFRKTGEWFAQHYQPGDRLAVEQPSIISYYTGLPDTVFLKLTELPVVVPDSLHQWLKQEGIDYIAWLSANRIFATDNAWYQWKMGNRGWNTIAFLGNGESAAGFTLIEEICIGPRKAFIYKI